MHTDNNNTYWYDLYFSRNLFTTKTFPNHFSVATGVYEEVHGVVGNFVYDPDLKRELRMTDFELFTQNPRLTPIWVMII